MQIEVCAKVFHCENTISAVDDIFKQINNLLAESKQIMRYLEIDGSIVEEGFQQYIVDNIETIKTIVVVVKNLRELMDDSLLSIKEYLERVIPEVDKIVDEFYYEVSAGTWDKFVQLLEGLQFIVESLNVICGNPDLYFNTPQFITIKENLLKRINMLQEAMESQDRVRISDVLLYEIIPSFKSLCWEINIHNNLGQVH